MHDTIPAALTGERVDRVVATLAAVSRRVAAELVENGAVTLDGATVTAGSTKVHEGQRIEITVAIAPEPRALAADASVELTVVFADDDIIVVNKPAGVVVHPAPGHGGATLVNGLLARFPDIGEIGEPNRPGIVHRLDKGTSGLLVVARSERAYRGLIGQLKNHRAERVYLALVFGVPASHSGIIDAPVGRSTRDRKRMAVRTEGKAARTRYSVEQAFRRPVPCALIKCELETGRTHQIRVHLSAIGHPVVGDPQYRGGRASIKAPRPMLHATQLVFDHPATGERLSFSVPIPADMRAVLEGLEE